MNKIAGITKRHFRAALDERKKSLDQWLKDIMQPEELPLEIQQMELKGAVAGVGLAMGLSLMARAIPFIDMYKSIIFSYVSLRSSIWLYYAKGKSFKEPNFQGGSLQSHFYLGLAAGFVLTGTSIDLTSQRSNAKAQRPPSKSVIRQSVFYSGKQDLGMQWSGTADINSCHRSNNNSQPKPGKRILKVIIGETGFPAHRSRLAP